MMKLLWAAWLVCFVLTFAALEWYAIANQQPTLSRCAWELGQKWPLILVIYGMLWGGLAVHFWWNWLPASNQSVG
jgi:hypothetical protein